MCALQHNTRLRWRRECEGQAPPQHWWLSANRGAFQGCARSSLNIIITGEPLSSGSAQLNSPPPSHILMCGHMGEQGDSVRWQATTEPAAVTSSLQLTGGRPSSVMSVMVISFLPSDALVLIVAQAEPVVAPGALCRAIGLGRQRRAVSAHLPHHRARLQVAELRGLGGYVVFLVEHIR